MTKKQMATIWTVRENGDLINPIEINIHPDDVERAVFNLEWLGCKTLVKYSEKPPYDCYNVVYDHAMRWSDFTQITDYYWYRVYEGREFMQMSLAAYQQGREKLGDHYAKCAEKSFQRAQIATRDV